jgi:hypothetical protein
MSGAAQAMEALHGYAFGDRLLEVRIAEDKQAPVKRPLVQRKTVFMPVTNTAPNRKKRPRLSR